jgi:hypothetical protein
MAARSSFAQRRREVQMGLMARMAPRAFTRKTTGLDGIVKKLMAKQAGPIEHDPELDHDDPDWLVPGPAPIDLRP